MPPEQELEPADEAPAPEQAQPEPGEAPAEGAVINHLIFHKALIGEGDDAGRLNAYIEMVKAKKEGAHLVMVNPFDRAIAIAFQLVIEKHLDPWKLDLVQFTEMYLQHVRESKEVDLITSGRLIFLAWTVLKLQSDDALVRAELSRAQPEPEPEQVSWDDIPTDAWLTDDGSYAFTTAVLQNKQPPIDEKVRHRGDRKVTLYELVEAFEEARQEAEMRLVLDTKRKEARAAWAKQSRSNVQGAAHKEDLEAEIQEVWHRITRLNGHPIPLKELHDGTRDDRIKALVASLFLARSYRISIWQENFPYGPIFVRNLNPEHAEPEAAAELAKRLEPARARARKGKGKAAAPEAPEAPAGPAEAAPQAKARGKAGTRKPRTKVHIDDMPVAAKLEVAGAVARALAAVLPPEVTRHG